MNSESSDIDQIKNQIDKEFSTKFVYKYKKVTPFDLSIYGNKGTAEIDFISLPEAGYIEIRINGEVPGLEVHIIRDIKKISGLIENIMSGHAQITNRLLYTKTEIKGYPTKSINLDVNLKWNKKTFQSYEEK